MRKTEFANSECYHIYNRGVDKRIIFTTKNDYRRFLLSMELLNDEKDGLMEEWRNSKVKLSDFQKLNFGVKEPLVEIIAYCLNPNHYHFILKQVIERGVERFMHKLGTSYTKYFNDKNDRCGSLFQGPFKSIHIDSNEYLLYLSAYVNKNYFIHNYGDDEWEYSSLSDYMEARNSNLCNKEMILSQFNDDYGDFLNRNSLYMKKNKDMEKYTLE